MYVGVDIGGTKTLVASLDDNGVILEKHKFLTPKDYESFIDELKNMVNSLANHEFMAGCIALPGKVDREKGIGEYFGNLPWIKVPIQTDAERIFNCPILIENDANLGALSESMLLPKDKRVLYITISTGIGTGFIINQKIAPELEDSEGGQMLLEYHGKRESWEDFASGKAIVERFGKKAAEINDDRTWHRIAHDLAIGFIELMAITQPEIIVVGGSVGYFFERFKDFLLIELAHYRNPLIEMPVFRKAARPEEAVLYGCYDLARQKYGKVN